MTTCIIGAALLLAVGYLTRSLPGMAPELFNPLRQDELSPLAGA